MKIKKGSCELSRKLDGIGIRKIRMFPFSCHSAYHSIAYNLLKTALSELEAEAEDYTNHITESKSEKTETMAATGLVGILAAVHLFQLLCFIMPVNRHKMFRHGSLLGTEPFKRVLEKRLHGKTS